MTHGTVVDQYTGRGSCDDATYDPNKDQSAVPVSMRLPMADMIADYGSDVHQILGKKMDGPTDFNQIEIDRGDLTRIIRATAEDPHAYKIIHASQSVVTAEGLDRFPADSFRKEDPELRAWAKRRRTPTPTKGCSITTSSAAC
ncbi:hypothetical protein [Streptomyces sp. SID3915]|uniref:hypothetical protein n=1 Tax=Streptomyces sp. SID3915 TaxID=2690263 RepID=UPI00136D8E3A|nr:hypothetical protein [Streptomyces sp. SID3915]MYX77074.1 hypothetical protein [Streptomyces sp. SID3915]